MCRETQQQCTCYSRVATLSVSCHVTSRDADQVSWLEELQYRAASKVRVTVRVFG